MELAGVLFQGGIDKNRHVLQILTWAWDLEMPRSQPELLKLR